MSDDFAAVDVIRAKRDGHALSDAQIDWVVDAYTKGVVADEQMSALAMAILLRGMTPAEIARWTAAMIASGERLDLSAVSRPTVDKHSTGGVGVPRPASGPAGRQPAAEATPPAPSGRGEHRDRSGRQPRTPGVDWGHGRCRAHRRRRTPDRPGSPNPATRQPSRRPRPSRRPPPRQRWLFARTAVEPSRNATSPPPPAPVPPPRSPTAPTGLGIAAARPARCRRRSPKPHDRR